MYDSFFKLAMDGGMLQRDGFDGITRDVRDVNVQQIASQTTSLTGTFWNSIDLRAAGRLFKMLIMSSGEIFGLSHNKKRWREGRRPRAARSGCKLLLLPGPQLMLRYRSDD